jgi:hypothetical protein
MKLLTNKIIEDFEKQGLTGELPDSEKKVIAKYFFPIGSTIWYALEYNPKENEFFGYIVKSGHNELGYFELEELEYVTIDGLRVERDLDWESNTTLEEVKRGDKE